jgi:DNA helicase HerA-like ATPase
MSMGMFIMTMFFWRKIKENRLVRQMLFIDEGSLLVGSSANTFCAELVSDMYKLGRGYGAGTVFATQEVNDLHALEGGKYGKAILSNSSIKFVLGMGKREVAMLNEELMLDEDKMASVVSAARGEVIVSYGTNNVPIIVKASALEHQIMNTDASQSKEIFEQLQQEKGKR